MISRFFNRVKPRVYLGKVVVAPRNEIKKIDQWGFFKSEDLEGGIRAKIDGIFSLPHMDAREGGKKSDLALEVVILKVQGGEFESATLGDIALPIFWRPKIEIAARLYNIDSGKTYKAFNTIEKMSWLQYFSGVFSLRGLVRYKPMFGVKELEPLLYRACEKVLIYMAKAV